MKVMCKKCGKLIVKYDNWNCCWVAICDLLGTSKNVSGYTEDEDNIPGFEVDLGRNNPYCKHSQNTK